jgi:hypothetical protein
MSSTRQNEIKGNTLRVYLYLVTHGGSELREIQRGLEFSTPSLASYHLTRLIRAGYVRQGDDGKYYALEEKTHELLEGYSRVGPTLIPQLFFFSVLFSILFGYFSYKALEARGYLPFLIASGAGAVVVMWLETWRLFRRLATIN